MRPLRPPARLLLVQLCTPCVAADNIAMAAYLALISLCPVPAVRAQAAPLLQAGGLEGGLACADPQPYGIATACACNANLFDSYGCCMPVRRQGVAHQHWQPRPVPRGGRARLLVRSQGSELAGVPGLQPGRDGRLRVRDSLCVLREVLVG